ncbi:amidohydrolase [Siminovitchia sediminis]|uniref:Amidohydrolase n=1 Tax=Siminovitchia sediminis TaxID=1274353 RepID=A0ABW4KET4_9BACI
MTKRTADLIITSNAVFTGLSNQPEPASIAIVNNKISAIGSEEEIKKYAGEQTRIFHYHDQLVMPGFHDFHLHIMHGAVSLLSVDLFSARSENEALEMIGKFAEDNPNHPWVVGFTWDSGYWESQKLPDRYALDRILPNRPAVMFHAEGHYAWVNSKALEIANINRFTENPSYGIIGKFENGEPNGILYEKAMEFVTKHAFDYTREQKAAVFHHFLSEAARLGITAVHNMYGTDSLSVLDDFDLFKEFEDKGRLTTRIHLWPALNGDLASAEKLREKYCSGKLQFSGLKQFIDGVVTSRTAYMLEPYTDKPDERGETAFPPELIKKWVVDADKEGFSVRFHAIGDGAIRLALDAYEEARKVNGPRDSRHAVEHVEVIHPDDIYRFKELGVTVSMQPDHFAMSERGVYTERIGKEREKNVFLIKTLLDSGANIAFGTDFPIDILNPLLQIYRAVTRVDSSGKDIWHPHERITLAEALKAYTIGSAYGSFRENELGTLEEGKLADIVVLKENPFDIPVEKIPHVEVELTVTDGEIVYENTKETVK